GGLFSAGKRCLSEASYFSKENKPPPPGQPPSLEDYELPKTRHKKTGNLAEPGFFYGLRRTYSSSSSISSASMSRGRPTSSTNAIGALSPARKPHFRIRR